MRLLRRGFAPPSAQLEVSWDCGPPDVEAETADYVHWFSTSCIYEYCGNMPAVEAEQINYTHRLAHQAS